LKVTGTLAAEEEAEVAAEIQGRVIATPVERGTRVAQGADLIRVSPAEAQAQAAEAEANAAQLERRLGLGGGTEERAKAFRETLRNAVKAFRQTAPSSKPIASLRWPTPARSSPGDRRIRPRQDAVRQAAVVEVRLRSEERAGGSGAAAVRDREKRSRCSSIRGSSRLAPASCSRRRRWPTRL
jgi:multidrug resistance efflux pump